MISRRAAAPVVIALVALGSLCVAVRAHFRQGQSFVPGDSLWRLSYSAEFHARKANARLRAPIPKSTRHSWVFHHDVDYGQLQQEHMRPSETDGHEIAAVAAKPGQFTLTAHFDIQLSPHASWRGRTTETGLSAQERQDFLRGDKDKAIPVDDPVVQQTLQQLLEGTADKADLVERLFDYCKDTIVSGGNDAPQSAVAALSKNIASPLGRARAMVALCRAGKIPARLVTGFEIKRQSDIQPQTWVEVFVDNRWRRYDPDNGFDTATWPVNFLPVRRDSAEIVHGTNVSDLKTHFSIAPLPLKPGMLDLARRHPLQIVNLERLPVQMHAVLKLLMLLPLGALLTAVLRTIVGIRTFGTFTPTLLALAFIYNDWRTGLVVFVCVMVLGLTSRTLLDRLKLLLVPRLSIILTLVVMCLVFAISVLDYFEYTPSAQAVLLPMVILTMTVERFYVTTEEDNAWFALHLLATTLGMAFCVYLVLRWDTVADVLLAYPELHFFTVAVLVLLGRYTGYRWTELWRFRDLLRYKP